MGAGYCFMIVLSSLLYEINTDSLKCAVPPKIAIIGAGIGGSSCSHFLTELFGPQVYVDLFEASEVGGRLKTRFVGPNVVELGGSVIHPRNKYMSEFLERFGLKKKTEFGGKLGIFNGIKIVFEESDSDIWNMISLLYRYGWDIFRIKSRIENMLDHFDKIYKFQDDGKSFRTVDELLYAMSITFPSTREISLTNSLRKELYKRTYFELVLSVMRVNYGQGGKLHEFVGSVSLAGAMPGLWAVQGGNKMIAEKLLNSSAGLILKAQVSQLSFNRHTKKYKVTYFSYDHVFSFIKEYDVVVIAAPLTPITDFPIRFTGDIDFENITYREYHTTYCNIIEGVLNYTYFRCKSAAVCPTEILTYRKTFFNSISMLFDREEDTPVWKVFSNEKLTQEQINLIFLESNVLEIVAWQAYPEYNTEKTVESFVLQDNLYYLNAIEWAASAMEMSVIAARNIALLVHNDWKNVTEENDCKTDANSNYCIKSEM